jgi:Spy/CpxP family protein refolding chaperone
MNKRILVIGGIAALIISATVFAVAQSGLKLNHFQERRSGPGESRHRGPGPEMMEHMARVLGLSEDQKTQIKALMDSNGPAEEARHQKMEEIQKQLEAATANGQFDEAKVRDLANQQAQLQAEGIVEHERMKSKVFALLTAEQRVKAEEMHKRMGDHPRRHSGPPPEGAPRSDSN